MALSISAFCTENIAGIAISLRSLIKTTGYRLVWGTELEMRPKPPKFEIHDICAKACTWKLNLL